MTSNFGAEYLTEVINGNGSLDEAKDNLTKSLRTKFKPEFLNRIDEIIVFNPLTKNEVLAIVDKILNETRKRLKEMDLLLDVSQGAKEYIARVAFDPIYGARPIKRYIQNTLETLIAKTLIKESVPKGATLCVLLKNNNGDNANNTEDMLEVVVRLEN